MGTGFARQSLVGRINDAFRADNIEATAQTAAGVGPNGDAFDIVHALGLFQLPPELTLETYRGQLPIPELNKAVLALAFQYSVQNKVPLSFAIVSGPEENVHLTTSDTLVSLVLTRID